MGERGPARNRWLLTLAIGLLSYLAAWTAYVCLAVATFAVSHLEMPHWDIWPVRAGFAAVAIGAALATACTATPTSPDESIRHVRFRWPHATWQPRLVRLLTAAGLAMVLALAGPTAVTAWGEWRFGTHLPPGWTKAEALDFGRRECSYLASQPWGESGAWARRAEALLGRDLTYRGTRRAVRVQQLAHDRLCPFQGFIHDHRFDLSEEDSD